MRQRRVPATRQSCEPATSAAQCAVSGIIYLFVIKSFSCGRQRRATGETMPIYEYRCTSCGHELEALQKLSRRAAAPSARPARSPS